MDGAVCLRPARRRQRQLCGCPHCGPRSIPGYSSAYDCVEVLVDGEPVGGLTKLQSEKLLPLVKYVERRGKIPVIRATVKGAHLKADVVLHTVTAETVDDDWLDTLGPETTTARTDSHQPLAPPDFEWDDDSEVDQREA